MILTSIGTSRKSPRWNSNHPSKHRYSLQGVEIALEACNVVPCSLKFLPLRRSIRLNLAGLP
jgi:hypothetical protein